MRTHNSGFTLVELSIVLVILGLLVGGVLTGQSLIKAAQIRSVLSESGKYLTAANAFRDKYFALPGDMNNATSFWGIVAGTGSDTTCYGTASTGLPTCNGNGDGQVSTPYENVRFWQHLANAELIEGRYNGSANGGSNVAGLNAPGSKLEGAVWLAYYKSSASSTSWFAIPPGNMIVVAAAGNATVNILKPEEAWNIDTKADDGLPGTGRLVPFKGTTGACTTATNTASPGDLSATYALSATAKECLALYWINAF